MPIDPVRRAPVPPSTQWLWELTSTLNLLIEVVGTAGGTLASVLWEDVLEKPETFPPSTHNHDAVYLKLSASANYEPDLGNPADDNYILYSQADGTRSWGAAPSGGGGSCFEADPNGDYMPAVTPIADTTFEVDGNGDIMPKL